MATSVARLYRAVPWFLLALGPGVVLTACSGSTQESPGSSSANPTSSSPPASNPPDPSNPGPVAATDTVVALTWQPNPDPIAGYIVYYGPAPDTTETLAVQLSLANNPFNGQAPHISFNAGRDLGLNYGDNVCFRLRAYNAANALSGWSAAACGTI